LDALVVGDHPQANPETHAAHACGHNAQIAGLIGAMIGLVKAGAAAEICGNVVFFAVPAVEYVEIEYRSKLAAEGKLSYLGGKPELVKLGHFDDIDMAVMIHTHSQPSDKKVLFSSSSNGCLVKMVKFLGRAAHAGAAPHTGVNALNAAHLALAAIHAQRETFKDEDTVRIHPIITKGGELVNVVPSDVRLETFVRAKTLEAIVDANAKLDRSLRAAAMAVGAKVEIKTLPGYLPITQHCELEEVFRSNSHMLYGEDQCLDLGHQTGSTDFGDISHIMPGIHPFTVGASGGHHSKDWRISDTEGAYLAPARLMAMTVIDLLWGNADKAREILHKHKPELTKEEYLSFLDENFKTEIYDGQTGKSEEILKPQG
jgi:amidohydrolase